MEIKFKKLSEHAIVPKKATKGSIAFDVYVPKDVIVETGRNVIPLGFAIELPVGYEAKIEPRSGFSAKGMEGYRIAYSTIEKPLIEKTTPFDFISRYYSYFEKESFVSTESARFNADVLVGKIDADYRGCVGVIVNNHEERRFMIKSGTRIAQMTIYHSAADWEFKEVEELSDTERGDGGFGHSGTK